MAASHAPGARSGCPGTHRPCSMRCRTPAPSDPPHRRCRPPPRPAGRGGLRVPARRIPALTLPRRTHARMTNDGKRIYVLDTNVLMHDPTALFKFEEHDV